MNNIPKILISTAGLAVLIHGQVQDIKQPDIQQDHPSDFGGAYIMKNMGSSSVISLSLAPQIVDLDA